MIAYAAPPRLNKSAAQATVEMADHGMASTAANRPRRTSRSALARSDAAAASSRASLSSRALPGNPRALTSATHGFGHHLGPCKSRRFASCTPLVPQPSCFAYPGSPSLPPARAGSSSSTVQFRML